MTNMRCSVHHLLCKSECESKIADTSCEQSLKINFREQLTFASGIKTFIFGSFPPNTLPDESLKRFETPSSKTINIRMILL